MRTCSCCRCGESPPPPPATPPLVLAACLLKRHIDSKLLDWRVILNVLPDQVCERIKFVSLFMNYWVLGIYTIMQVVFVLVDFAIRLMVTPAPINNHLIDVIKV